MIALAEEIYRTRTVSDDGGNTFPLRGSIDEAEGKLITSVIAGDEGISKTLEVGCAFGLSSLYICSATAKRPGPQHTIIDPNQSKEWRGIGISNLRRAGLNFFTLVEEPSEFALPQIARTSAGTFDLVFIDGWHTFDHTLLDAFYANRLLRVGGYVVIDDCTQAPVAKAVNYIAQYPAYEIVGQSTPRSAKHRAGALVRSLVPPALAGALFPRLLYDRYYLRCLYSSMVALKKVREDDRSWTWFVPF
jgi:predicted O-methyltransferase YrrM